MSSLKASSFPVSVLQPSNREQLNIRVQSVLGAAPDVAAESVDTFDNVVAKPLQANLSKKKG